MSVPEIVKLRQRIEELEEENRWLRDQMTATPDGGRFHCLGLTVTEEKILSAIYNVSPGTISTDRLAGMTGRRKDPDEMTNPRGNVNVYIWRLRKKLRPMGVHIRTAWDVGFFIDAESKNKLEEKVNGR